MSWLDRLNNIKLTITTGEGSEFTPLVKTASRSRNMNASVFNFNNVQGSLVKRGKAEGMRYPFELHFTGEDHLDDSASFNTASLDTRPWTITHPHYGTLLVQPISINFDDNQYNDTVVTGEWFETIQDTYPDSSIEIQEDVLESVETAIDAQEAILDIEEPTTSLAAISATVLDDVTTSYKSAAISDEDLQNVINAAADASTALDTITDEPYSFMQAMATLLRTPSKFYASINSRIAILQESYDNLKTAITGTSTAQEKLLFESVGGCMVTAMCEASVYETDDIADEQFIEDNTTVDYKTRSDVISISESLKESFDDYLDTLGEYQSTVDADPDSYTPKATSINYTKQVINKAAGNLLQLAVSAKQERTYTLPSNMSLLILVHRLYGTYDDDTVQDFADNNDLLMDEWLQVPQGREVTYYI